MRLLRFGLCFAVLLLVAAAFFVVLSRQPVIAGVEAPPRSAFDQTLIEKGAKLAAIGNCYSCHTTRGKADYSGSRAIPTPFGTIFSANITPAPGTGIGRWPEEAFRRAMREGISRRGEHLFPAFPYDHYARLTDDDLHALYAFLMTRTPVESFTPRNALPFPLNKRWPLAFWNVAFLDKTPFQPNPQQSDAWNRGAYLVAGLGHCGDCHTPRNLFSAEESSRPLEGGAESEGWVGPALNTASPAPVPWDEAHLFTYLRHGWADQHGAAAGPMQPVVTALARADDADIHAMATYLAAQQGPVSTERQQRASAALARAAEVKPPAPAAGEELGATIFAGACASCHTGSAAMVPPHGINLALSSALYQPEPTNAIQFVLRGVQPSGERSGPLMPRFADTFTDAQMAALLRYLRAHYATAPPWHSLESKIRDLRQRKGPL
ncbi:MAG TPA: cytochrome c [Stellaceae bacterium]|jgi:mono/diheme cytochrome c family protein|nr:cytochrome c [Stellaceae bacterium]